MSAWFPRLSGENRFNAWQHGGRRRLTKRLLTTMVEYRYIRVRVPKGSRMYLIIRLIYICLFFCVRTKPKSTEMAQAHICYRPCLDEHVVDAGAQLAGNVASKVGAHVTSQTQS